MCEARAVLGDTDCDRSHRYRRRVLKTNPAILKEQSLYGTPCMHAWTERAAPLRICLARWLRTPLAPRHRWWCACSRRGRHATNRRECGGLGCRLDAKRVDPHRGRFVFANDPSECLASKECCARWVQHGHQLTDAECGPHTKSNVAASPLRNEWLGSKKSPKCQP